MATYLQGVTDYIPEFQPFQPDLNFYNGLLQTKQTQYDKNYKALSNIYGQYFYSELTREPNIQRKDEIIKNIDFQLKKISGLDLSLEQNVKQATQVFRPFYENKFLMKDMAWTKNYRAQMDKSQGLKSSTDPKERGLWWEEGDKEMMYKREEFKNSSDEESLGFGNASYTLYKNPVTTMLDLAESRGLHMDIERYSEDGKMIFREKNGKQLYGPALKLFQAEVASDPELLAVYNTKAYVQAKDNIYALANQKYNGDYAAAENEYLPQRFKEIRAYVEKKNKEAQVDKSITNNKLTTVNNEIENDNDNMYSQDFVQYLNTLYKVDNTVAQHTQAVNEEVNGARSSTMSTSGGYDSDDIASLRRKVNAGNAMMFMYDDMETAAYLHSIKDMGFSMKPNEYALEATKHAYNIARDNNASKNKQQEDLFKHQLNKIEKGIQWGLDNGTMISDSKGNIIPTGAGESTYVYKGAFASGGVEDAADLEKLNKQSTREYADQYAKDYLMNVVDLYQKEVKAGRMKESDAIKQLHTHRFKTLDEYARNLQENGTSYIAGLDHDRVRSITSDFNSWYGNNRGINTIKSTVNSNGFAQSAKEMNTYLTFLKGKQEVEQKNYNFMRKKLMGEGLSPKEVDMFLNKNGTVNSFDEFERRMVAGQKGQITVKDDQQFRSMKNTLLNSLSKAEEEQMYKYVEHKLKTQSSIFNGDWVPDFVSNMAGNYDANKYRDEWLRNKFMSKKSTYNAFGLVKDRNDELERIYDNLSSAYQKAHKSNEWSTYGALRGKGTGKAGVYSVDGQAMEVIPTTMLPTTRMFQEVADDVFQRIGSNVEVSFGLQADNELSASGATKSALEYSKEQGHKDIALSILREMDLNVGYPKSKLGRFTVVAGQVAGENRNKAAVTIIPDRAFLQSMKEKDSRITQPLIDAMVSKGITFVAPKSSWSNSLINQTNLTPTQGLVEALGTYKWQHPDNAGGYEVTKNTKGEYVVNYYLNEYDPKKNKMVRSNDPSANGYTIVPLGNNLDSFLSDVYDNIYYNDHIQDLKYKQSKNK